MPEINLTIYSKSNFRSKLNLSLFHNSSVKVHRSLNTHHDLFAFFISTFLICKHKQTEAVIDNVYTLIYTSIIKNIIGII